MEEVIVKSDSQASSSLNTTPSDIVANDENVSEGLLNGNREVGDNEESGDNRSIQSSPNVDLRVQKTIALYICFMALGLAASLVGSTLVHMEIIFGTTTKTMALTFTCHSIGYTLGALMCGLVYDRTNKEFSLSVATVLQAGSVVAAAFVPNLYSFILVMSVVGLGQGYIDAASQSYCVGLWYNHRLKEPLLQAAHAFWSLGAATGPLIIQQFLVELPDRNATTVASSTTSSMISSTISLYNSSITDFSSYDTNTRYESSPQYDTSTPGYDLDAIKRARYAYLTIGSLMLVSAIPYISLYLYRCAPLRIKSVKKSPEGNSVNAEVIVNKRKDRLFNVLLLILLFTFYYLYLYIENIPSGYFVTFVLRQLSWSVKDATMLVTVFFIFHCAGRFLAIPLSALLRPRTMVAINLVLVALAYSLILLVLKFDKIMWVSASIAGIGMASTFAAMILWTSESVLISGRVASVMLIGSSLGGATGPALVGWLMDTYNMMWMVYILVLSGLLHIVAFIVFIFFFRWRRNMVRDHTE